MSTLDVSSADGHPAAVASPRQPPPQATRSEADLLDEYLRRAAAGDTIAFQALFDSLSPCVRDAAACLFGHGDTADRITDAVFVDVRHLAHEYRPDGRGVRTWVLHVAGQHTMSRYQPDPPPDTGARRG